ncbi:MAG: hypothetical protein L6V93_20585 [Clostridiales bacterium]|nr:MAG: hypothetical protein L6V93_20585 [Clostridiales bacterium]
MHIRGFTLTAICRTTTYALNFISSPTEVIPQWLEKYLENKLKNGYVPPLKKGQKKDASLKKAADSIEVRVRQGWKPAPSPVENQTPETEPEMHVACDFDRVGDISKSFKKEGIKNAEFCLVGWNIGGHDGRFSADFPPVDERLGGEEKAQKPYPQCQSRRLRHCVPRRRNRRVSHCRLL